MLIRRELVTPEKAVLWMKKATLNRRIDLRRVESYAEDMTRGRWNYGHDEAPASTIMLNGNGTPLDGHHRLLAVSKAGKGQWFIVQREMPLESAILTDRGKPKTLSDAIRMYCNIKSQKVPSSIGICATAMRVIVGHERGLTPGGNLVPVTVLLEWFKAHRRELEGIATKSGTLRNLMSQGYAAGLWYLFAKQSASEADAFFTKLKTGQGIERGAPVGVLRQRLIAERAKKGRERAHAFTIGEWTIRAWNATRDGARWHKLPRNVGGYPAIK